MGRRRYWSVQRDSLRINPDIGATLRDKLTGKMDALLTEVGQRGEMVMRQKARRHPGCRKPEKT